MNRSQNVGASVGTPSRHNSPATPLRRNTSADSPKTGRKLRVLVAVASFGEKNLGFLRKIIAEYQSMAMDVDIVVHSEAPKRVDLGVKVIVGLPSRNPHSLPFAHKRTFAESVDRYDLFVYTEDDMKVSEQHVRAFLEVTAELESDEILGYIRYEIGEGEAISLPDVHGHFHWKPESVRRRGRYTLAEFTNEHAGFYVLTQAQLRQAIASGGFLREPAAGRYGMLETGATDPYTSCGFRKVICISAFDDFLIHHMPNRYAGVLGVPLNSFKAQIQTLMDIYNGDHPATTLCEVEPKVLQQNWYKSYHEGAFDELLNSVPASAETILSVGCGWGATEIELQKRGAGVTALPLNSVVGASVARSGIEVINGTLTDCSRILIGRKFHCVIISNLLHLLPEPWAVLQQYARLVADGGTLVIAGSNFDFLPHLWRRVLRRGEYGKLGRFDQSGLHVHGAADVRKQIERVGFRVTRRQWFNSARLDCAKRLHRWAGRFVARNWIIQARRDSE